MATLILALWQLATPFVAAWIVIRINRMGRKGHHENGRRRPSL